MGSGRELVKNLGIKEQFDFSLVIKNALVLLLMSKYIKSDIYGIHGFSSILGWLQHFQIYEIFNAILHKSKKSSSIECEILFFKAKSLKLPSM